MFSTDKQMGYQCFVSFFDLRDSSQIGMEPGQMPLWGWGGSDGTFCQQFSWQRCA